MGVLNVTPDSFSDGGSFLSPADAVRHAEQMAADGADLLDIGGESTRPGSERVSSEVQIARVVPVLRAISGLGIPISIDTTLSEVAAAALDAGASIVNDISAGRDDPDMLRLVARAGVPVILMHMQGQPKSMQQSPRYDDVAGEVMGFLNERIIEAGTAGIALDNILIDPGIGFGKTTAHNLELLSRLRELTTLGRPIVLGTSRKRFIGELSGGASPADRVFGTAGSIAWGVINGASILRVHDVGPMRQVLQVVQAIMDAPNPISELPFSL